MSHQYLLGGIFGKASEAAWSSFLEHTAEYFNEGLAEGYKAMAEQATGMQIKKRLTRTMTFKLEQKDIRHDHLHLDN